MRRRHIIKDAYYEGYKHGLNEKPYDPQPKLVAILTDKHCLRTYLAAYDDGYRRASKDRELLLEQRCHDNDRCRENSSISREP